MMSSKSGVRAIAENRRYPAQVRVLAPLPQEPDYQQLVSVMLQSKPEIIARLGRIGVDSQRFLELRDGFFDLARLFQGNAEIDVGFKKVGFDS